MREITEFRINYDFAHLLFRPDEGKDLGQLSKSIKIVQLAKDDPRYAQIPIVAKDVKEKYGRGFFFSWEIKRKYSKKELADAKLFRLIVKSVFEPAGEECGTFYDDSACCPICGTSGNQKGPLRLGKNSIPKKDIAKTIAGEIVVSEKFASAVKKRRLRGLLLNPVFFGDEISDYYQLAASKEIELSETTVAGNDPFVTETGSDGGVYEVVGRQLTFSKEVYVCPMGHLIGLNILSELHICDDQPLDKSDLFFTVQKVGVRRGLLRPESLVVCSPMFRKMVDEEKLTGFKFEIARLE